MKNLLLILILNLMACTPPSIEPQSRWLVYYNDGAQRVPIYAYNAGVFSPTAHVGLASLEAGVFGLDYGFELQDGTELFGWDESSGRVVARSVSTDRSIPALPRVEFVQKREGLEMMIAYACEDGLWVTRIETESADFIAGNTNQFRLGGDIAIHPAVGLQCDEFDVFVEVTSPTFDSTTESFDSTLHDFSEA